jgi:gamma-glutamyltranspeptidase
MTLATVTGTSAMVTAPHYLASRAGLGVLRDAR